MENDNLKTEDDQMEIIMMMQQMDKIPEFCSTYNDLSPPSDFSSSSNMSTNDRHCLENLQAAESSPPFMNLTLPPSTVSAPNGGAAQERQASVLAAGRGDPFPATSSRWRSSVISGGENEESQKQRSVAAMREMIFRIAVMQPIQIDPESVKPPKRRNVKISTDPQSVAARHRRERISERIRILQRLVPGGTKMDTASMLDEAIHYVKFLKTQVQSLEKAAANRSLGSAAVGVGSLVGPLFPSQNHPQCLTTFSNSEMLNSISPHLTKIV